MSDLMRRLENRFYAAVRHPDAGSVACDAPAVDGDLESLRDAEYCLLVSYRRDGTPVPTPLWFALDGDRAVFESDADAVKLKRLRRNPRVRVAAATFRGRPLAPPVEAVARILAPEEEAPAERALAEKYGRTRRVLQRMRPPPPAGLAYVELRARSDAGVTSRSIATPASVTPSGSGTSVRPVSRNP